MCRSLLLLLGIVLALGTAYGGSIKVVAYNVDAHLGQDVWSGIPGSKAVNSISAGGATVEVSTDSLDDHWTVSARLEAVSSTESIQVFVSNSKDSLVTQLSLNEAVILQGIGDETVTLSFELAFPNGVPPAGEAFTATVIYSLVEDE